MFSQTLVQTQNSPNQNPNGFLFCLETERLVFHFFNVILCGWVFCLNMSVYYVHAWCLHKRPEERITSPRSRVKIPVCHQVSAGSLIQDFWNSHLTISLPHLFFFFFFGGSHTMLPRLCLKQLSQMILWFQHPELLDYKLDETTGMCHQDALGLTS